MGERTVTVSSGAAFGRVRYWWQTRPLIGLTVGWIVIALVAWRVWAALFHHHG